VATLTFDKLAYVDRLKAAGVGEREARALAEGLDQALREEVATKTDVAAVNDHLATVKAELKADIAALRTELKGDIAALRAELKDDIATVRTELAAVKHDMLRWMVGMAFAQVGLTVALVRLLPH
jgi:hypothetical protein